MQYIITSNYSGTIIVAPRPAAGHMYISVYQPACTRVVLVDNIPCIGSRGFSSLNRKSVALLSFLGVFRTLQRAFKLLTYKYILELAMIQLQYHNIASRDVICSLNSCRPTDLMNEVGSLALYYGVVFLKLMAQ